MRILGKLGRAPVRALAGALVVLIPSIALAQASITGNVKDTSGAVLPGVTVEAASPVLIEKARTVVTDSNGRFQIVDLRPVCCIQSSAPSYLQFTNAVGSILSPSCQTNSLRCGPPA